MAEKSSETEHGGILIRGADGSLWFMRDDADAPVRVSSELSEKINSLLEPETAQLLSFPLNEEAVEALASEFGELSSWGAIITGAIIRGRS